MVVTLYGASASDRAASAQSSRLAAEPARPATTNGPASPAASAATIYTWGANTDGALGSGATTPERISPASISLATGVSATAISGGQDYGLAIGTDGHLYAWGSDTDNLGNGTASNTYAPIVIPLPSGVTPTAISAGWDHSLVIGSDGNLYAFGQNAAGGIGNGTKSSAFAPTVVKLAAGVAPTAIAASYEDSFAIGSNGTLYSWGLNNLGQLGLGTTTNEATPQAVSLPAGVSAVSVSAGVSATYVIGSNGVLYAFGSNADGQLGNGTTTNQSVPTAVTFPGNATVASVSAGSAGSDPPAAGKVPGGFALARTTSGGLFAWGLNNLSQLGDGTTTNHSSPEAITLAAGVTVESISAGDDDSMAIGANGELYGWGLNGTGQIGNGNTTAASVPVAVELAPGVTVTGLAASLGGTSMALGTAIVGASLSLSQIPDPNVYIADTGNNRVVELPAAGSQVVVGSGLTFPGGVALSGPEGVAVDAAGDVYIADTGNNRVVEVPAGGGTPTTVGAGLKFPGAKALSKPQGVAVDGVGDVYIADTGNNRVVEVPAGGGAPKTVGTGLVSPGAVAVDAAGDVIISNLGTTAGTSPATTRVVEVPVGGGAQVTLWTTAAADDPVTGVAVDAAGDVYLSSEVGATVEELPAGGQAARVIDVDPPSANPMSSPAADVAVDAAGDVYVTVPSASGSTGGVEELPAGTADVPPAQAFSTSLGSGFDNPGGIAVGLPAATSAIGRPLSLTATVEPSLSEAPPSGTVGFFDGSTNVGTASLEGGSPDTATVTGVTIPPGSTKLTAVFEGNQGERTSPSSPPLSVVTSDSSPTGVSLTPEPTPPPNLIVTGYVANQIVEEPNTGEQSVVGAGRTFPDNIALSDPTGLAVDAAGDVFAADSGNNRVVEVPAGDQSPQLIDSSLNDPRGVAVDSAGDVFIADTGDNRIVEVPTGGSPRTVISGLDSPEGVATDSAGDVYVADTGNNRVLEMPAGGGATVTIGSGLNGPDAVAADASGNVFIADTGDFRVVEDPAGGSPQLTIGTVGSVLYSGPESLAVDAGGDLYVGAVDQYGVIKPNDGYSPIWTSFALDQQQPVTVALTPTAPDAPQGTPLTLQATVLTTPAGGLATGTVTFNVGSTVLGAESLSGSLPDTAKLSFDAPGGTFAVTASYSGSTDAAASGPSASVTIDDGRRVASGTSLTVTPPATPDVYVADATNNQIVEDVPGGSTQTVVASNLSQPSSVAVSPSGDVYFAEPTQNEILELAPGSSTPSVVDVGITLSGPSAVAVDSQGNLYFNTAANGSIFELPAAGGAAGLIAGVPSPTDGLAVDSAGDVFISSAGNDSVYELSNYNGTLETVGAGFGSPRGLAVDAAGDLYVADYSDNRVIELPARGGGQRLIGTALTGPEDVAVDAAGDVFVTDSGNDTAPGQYPTQVVEVPADGGPQVSVGKGFADPSGTAVATQSSSSTAGSPVTLTATVQVSPSGDTTTGSVTFSEGNTVLGTAALSGDYPDTATLTIDSLPVGTDQVTAAFEGNIYDAPSTTSAPVTITVGGLSGVGTSLSTSPSGGTNLYVVQIPATQSYADQFDEELYDNPSGFGAQMEARPGWQGIPGGFAASATETYKVDGSFVLEQGVANKDLGSGLVNANGLALDNAGDVFVADTGNNRVVEIPASGAAQTVVGAGLTFPGGLPLSAPDAVAVDPAGDVFIADTGNNRVVEVPVGGGAPVTVGTGLSAPQGLTADASGDLYIADTGNNRVVEIPARGGDQITFATTGTNQLPLAGPEAVAVDPTGNVYVADTGNARVVEFPSSGGIPTNVGFGLDKPQYLAITAPPVQSATGVPLHLVATVDTYPAGATPAGAVQFSAGGTVIGTASLSGAFPDTATLTVTDLPVGTTAISATFVASAGTGGSLPSSSISVVTSGPVATGTTLSTAPPPNSPTLYVANSGSCPALELPPGGAKPVPLTSSTGVAVDAAGDLFSLENPGGNQTGTFLEETKPNGTQVQLIPSTELSQPTALAVDAHGDVYIGNDDGDDVVELPAGSSTLKVVVPSVSNGLTSLAVDTAGDLFVNPTETYILEYPAGGGTPIPIAQGLNYESLTGLTVDAAGDLFFTAEYVDSGLDVTGPGFSRLVAEIPAGGGPLYTVGTLSVTSNAVAVDAAGDVFAGGNGTAITEYPVGGGTPVAIPDICTGVGTGTGEGDATELAVSEPPLTVSAGSPETLVATVEASPNGASPTGTVSFYSGTTLLGTSSLSGVSPDTATLNVPSLGSPGAVTAVYNGDPVDLASTSDALNSTVVTETSGATVTVSPAPSPNIYIGNQAGGQIVEDPSGGGAQTTLASGLAGSFLLPSGVAVDGAGTVFTADAGADEVLSIPAGGGPATPVGTGLADPVGVAADAAGDVLIADTGNNRVVEVPAGGGTQKVLASGLSGPEGVAVDAAGDVFVADTVNNRVLELPAAGGAPFVIGSGFSDPSAVAVDPAGDVFVADVGHNRIVEIPAGGAPEATLAWHPPTGFVSTAIQALAVDAGGNLYVAYLAIDGSGDNDGQVVEIPSDGGPVVAVGSGLSDPAGVAIGVPASSVISPRSVTLTATIDATSLGDSAPTGTVTFLDGTTPLGTSPLSGTYPDTASLSTTSLPAGTDDITATYGGGNGYPPSAASAAVTADVASVGTVWTTDLSNRLLQVSANGTATPVPGATLNGFIPAGVASDSQGDLFVAMENENEVIEIPAGGGAQKVVGAGLNPALALDGPTAVAIGASGTVYIADTGDDRVVAVPPNGGAWVVVASGLSEPSGVAVDALGDVYISEAGNGDILQVGPGPEAVVESGLDQPAGLALDSRDDIYVTLFGSNQVEVFAPGSSTGIPIGASWDEPDAVALDAAGDVLVADATGLIVVPASGGPEVYLDSDLDEPVGVATYTPPPPLTAASPARRLKLGHSYKYQYRAARQKGQPKPFFEVLRGGLPSGLTLNSSTGVLSGKPSKVGTYRFIVGAANGAKADAGPLTTVKVVRS
jgi:alpha-tubulin suppressor-like RCC1 family protein/sugar lactone lactonase YvrE